MPFVEYLPIAREDPMVAETQEETVGAPSALTTTGTDRHADCPFRDMLNQMTLTEKLQTLLDFARVEGQAENAEAYILRKCREAAVDVAFQLLVAKEHASAIALLARYQVVDLAKLLCECCLSIHPEDPVRRVLEEMQKRLYAGQLFLLDLLET